MWVHQVHNFGLGNFINCTPTIKELSKIHNKPVNVYFDLPFVRDCFKDCEFINILDKNPNIKPLFNSSLTNTSHNNKPDYQYIFEQVTGKKWNGQRCYVDQPKEFNLPFKEQYFVIVAGSGNESRKYLDTKEIPKQYYLDAIKASEKKGLIPVFVGSENDLKRNEWAKNMVHVVGDVRKALALISGAIFVIGNDTGLIHAAGAINKKMFVFWKNTQLPRCMNSGLDCTYLMRSEWGKVNDLVLSL